MACCGLSGDTNTLTSWRPNNKTFSIYSLYSVYNPKQCICILHQILCIYFYSITLHYTCNISLIFDTFWVDHELSWLSTKKINKQTLNHGYNFLKNCLIKSLVILKGLKYTCMLDVCCLVFTAFTWNILGWTQTKVTVKMWHLPVVSGIGTCSSSKNGVSLWT